MVRNVGKNGYYTEGSSFIIYRSSLSNILLDGLKTGCNAQKFRIFKTDFINELNNFAASKDFRFQISDFKH